MFFSYLSYVYLDDVSSALIWNKRGHLKDIARKPIKVEIKKTINPKRTNFCFYKDIF